MRSQWRWGALGAIFTDVILLLVGGITHPATSALGYGGTDHVTAVRTGFARARGENHPRPRASVE